MLKLREELKSVTIAGGAVGGFVGLVVFIWAAIVHIQPALSTGAKLGDLVADFITLGIAFCGGLEISLGLGVLIGMVKALLLFSLIYIPIVCIKKGCDDTTILVIESSQQLKKLSEGLVHKELEEVVIEKQIGISEKTKDPVHNNELVVHDSGSESIDKKLKRSSVLSLFSTGDLIKENTKTKLKTDFKANTNEEENTILEKKN